jgi:F-type H+-transporting ATPase subunit beta
VNPQLPADPIRSETALEETLKGCRAILNGVTDDWAESSVYMTGTLDDARAKEEKERAIT